MSFSIKSSAFSHNGAIPREYTCEGEDTSPALEWSGFPPGTGSLALIVDDPDAPDPKAPKMTYVHWVLYDIPSGTTSMADGGAMPVGARKGRNDWNRLDYGGPCPPIGRHRYFFKIYALDALLGDLNGPTKTQLEQAMTGHVLGKAELMGTYEKKKQG